MSTLHATHRSNNESTHQLQAGGVAVEQGSGLPIPPHRAALFNGHARLLTSMQRNQRNGLPRWDVLRDDPRFQALDAASFAEAQQR